MGLDVPDLDDRTYEELLEDAVKRLPVQAPEWTDHNAADPGVTLLELLAWLADTHGYQLDQLTDAHRRKYLELVGVRPRPPGPATVALSVEVPDGFEFPGGGRVLPAGTGLVAETDDREHVPFETVEDVPLTRADIAAVVSEHERGRTDHTSDNETAGRSFLAFGREAGHDDALYLGFDRDPFADGDRLALSFEFHGESPSEALERDDGAAFEPSLELRWEHCADAGEWYRDDAWEPVAVARDDTTHFYRGGRVVLEAPGTWQDDAEAAAILGREEDLFWLRCRVRQRDPPTGERVPAARLASERLTEQFASLAPCPSAADQGEPDVPRRTERYEVPPRFDAVRTNVVPARHRDRDAGVRLRRRDRGAPAAGFDPAETTGEPDQRFAFPDAPVVDADVAVGGDAWTRVDDFDASGPDDRHYVLDRAAGVVRFGDGRRGAIPPVGRTVVADAVVYGGGPDGNVRAGSDWRFTAGAYRPLAVEPRAPPAGGRDAESVADALTRARRRREVPHRAVTAADYRELAVRTPGVRVERAEAVAGDCADGRAAGTDAVTVVVVPAAPPYRRRAIPTRGFLRAVERHLCARSLLTDRVSVVAPRYVGVRITAEVVVVDGRAPGTVREAAEAELTSFLDPLDGYDGDGWPFDRPVHTSELYERLESLPGVEDAVDVSVGTAGPDLATDRTALPYPESVTVTVREDREQCGRGF